LVSLKAECRAGFASEFVSQVGDIEVPQLEIPNEGSGRSSFGQFGLANPQDRSAPTEVDRDRLSARLGAEGLGWVISPYRVCPLGAHIDHQGGPVLGAAITAHTLLAFRGSDDGKCRILSEHYPGEVTFDIDGIEPAAQAQRRADGIWGLYAQGAAALMREIVPGPLRGIEACSSGFLPGGGLSSSASITLAYCAALAAVNGLDLEDRQYVDLAKRTENEWVGVACGILDPASIVGGLRGHLLSIDTQKVSWVPLAKGASTPGFRILIAYTGMSRNLGETGFNSRVEECAAAARSIAKHAGLEPVDRLGELPEDVLEDALGRNPGLSEPALERRARHFHEERSRVRKGIAAWQAGDLGTFGALMNDSCRSSRENFETGSPELVDLHAIMGGCDGVYGARFSGAGFAGCAIGLVAEEKAVNAAQSIERDFASKYPALSQDAHCFLVDSDDGLRVV